MSYSDFIATLALVVSFLSALPGIISLWIIHRNAKVRLLCEVSWPQYARTFPQLLFVQLTFEPGAKAMHLSSVEATGSGLGLGAGPSAGFLTTGSCDLRSVADIPPKGTLTTNFTLPSRAESPCRYSMILLLTNPNRDNLHAVTLSLRWSVVSKWPLKYEHRTTLTVRLIDENGRPAHSGHSEITI